MRFGRAIAGTEPDLGSTMTQNPSNILIRLINRLRDALNQISLAVWVAGLVILSTLGFIALGNHVFPPGAAKHPAPFQKQHLYRAGKICHCPGRQALPRSWCWPNRATRFHCKHLRKKSRMSGEILRRCARANQVEALQGYISQIEGAVTKASGLLAKTPLDRKALFERLMEADGTIGTLSYIAGKGSRAEWENLLAGKKSSLMIIVALIALASGMVGLLGLFITRRINRVISDVIRINAAIANGDTQVAIPIAAEKSETGKLYSALRSFRDSVNDRAKMEAARQQVEQLATMRQQKIGTLINSFRMSVMSSIAAVSEQIGKMETAAVSVTGIASEMANQSSEAKSASLESSRSVQSVAMGAEELAGSINLINRQVSETAQIVVNGASNAAATTLKIDGLSNSAQKIGDILSSITDIAQQTNVLALNATIEAARAGEAGQGL